MQILIQEREIYNVLYFVLLHQNEMENLELAAKLPEYQVYTKFIIKS